MKPPLLQDEAQRPALCLIIGAMKAGTTSLFDWLSRHPQVCPARVKEPDYFCSGIAQVSTWEDYLDLWAWDPTRHRVAIEASTAYTKYPWVKGVPRRISEHGLNPLFIYILRDPLQRIESHVNFMRHRGPVRIRRRMRNPIVFSNYYLQLQQYTRFFHKENFLLLPFEELSADPAATMGRICRFLGIEEEPAVAPIAEDQPPPSNPTPPRSTAEAAALYYDRFGVRHRVGPKARRVIKAVLRASGGGWHLSPGQRREITARLAPDMQRLHAEWGFDVTRWGYQVAAEEWSGGRHGVSGGGLAGRG